MSADETAALDALLALDFQGVEVLRAQASGVNAALGCTCGCASIDLYPRGEPIEPSTAKSPVPAEATIVSDAGEENGGVLLFLTDGVLSYLEVYSYLDDPIRSFPSPSQLRPTIVDR